MCLLAEWIRMKPSGSSEPAERTADEAGGNRRVLASQNQHYDNVNAEGAPCGCSGTGR